MASRFAGMRSVRPAYEIARLLQFPGAVAVVEIGGEQSVLLFQARGWVVRATGEHGST
jgi:hypothetical protein